MHIWAILLQKNIDYLGAVLLESDWRDMSGSILLVQTIQVIKQIVKQVMIYFDATEKSL